MKKKTLKQLLNADERLFTISRFSQKGIASQYTEHKDEDKSKGKLYTPEEVLREMKFDFLHNFRPYLNTKIAHIGKWRSILFDYPKMNDGEKSLDPKNWRKSILDVTEFGKVEDLLLNYIGNTKLRDRFEHSIRVGEMAGKIAKKISKKSPKIGINPYWVQFSGYLHELGIAKGIDNHEATRKIFEQKRIERPETYGSPTPECLDLEQFIVKYCDLVQDNHYAPRELELNPNCWEHELRPFYQAFVDIMIGIRENKGLTTEQKETITEQIAKDYSNINEGEQKLLELAKSSKLIGLLI
jgi:hypothetical protein